LIAVDTSVWVQALRSRESREASHLDRLLDEDAVLLPIPVRVELLSGSSKHGLPKLTRLLSALPVLEPRSSTWVLVLKWTEEARNRSQRFGFGDLLIGAIAAEADAPIWSLDDDFVRMRRLGFLKIHEP
jgi:predicted nucleic acid-binding protein